MNSPKQTARISGALYLVVVLCGLFSLMYVPSKISNWSDPSAMINNIINYEYLFRLGVVAEIIGFGSFLVLPLALYKLLNQVDKTQAVLMVAFAVVSVPMSFVNMLNKFAALTLLSKANYLSAIDVQQIHTQVLLHLDYSRNSNLLASIFWGLWLFPFGYLVFKSGFLPKVLGAFLMFGCIGYLVNFTGDFLFASYYTDSVLSKIITVPGSLGEIGICLWMLIAGVSESKPLAN